MQKTLRLDLQFENLQQGGMSHADFRAVWTQTIQDMKGAQMDLPSEKTLYRKYLMKLNPELRKNVISKDWKIDGKGKPQRAPETALDLQKAVGLFLEEKADIHAAGQNNQDSLMSLDGSMPGFSSPGGAGQKGGGECHYCNMVGHHKNVCPQQASDKLLEASRT